MLADLMNAGDWYAPFNHLDTDRHAAPTVEAVDFPKLGIRQAHNDPSDGVLTVETYAATRAASGEPTRWRVTNLPDAGSVVVERDGQTFGGWRSVDENAIEITSTVASQIFRVRTGWLRPDAGRPAATRVASHPRSSRISSVNPLEIVTASREIAAGASGCPCCA